MKIAICSDIHGIWPALTAVIDHIERWQPDQVVVNGDVVNRGPHSARCWDELARRRAENGWRLLRGNHENYVLGHLRGLETIDSYGYPLLSSWTTRQLNGRAAQFADLPTAMTITAPDGSDLYITHASRRHDRDGILPWSDAATMRAQIAADAAPAPAAFATAHIHLPGVWRLDETCIVNSGSVGTPADGDVRASYAQVTWTATAGWQARVIRVPYDRPAAERDFHESGFLLQGNPFARLIFHEWRRAQPVIPFWSRQYHAAVADGLVSLNWTVDRFLAASAAWPSSYWQKKRQQRPKAATAVINSESK